MAIFGPKPWVNPFRKISIFQLFGVRVFIAQKSVLSFQNIVKDIFQTYIAKKKKVGKLAIFAPKPWVNPFGKMSIFRLFEGLVFITQKRVLSFQNIVKDIFLAYIAKRKKIGKLAIFGPKPWVNPFGKISILLTFLNFLFLQPRKAFYRSRIS